MSASAALSFSFGVRIKRFPDFETLWISKRRDNRLRARYLIHRLARQSVPWHQPEHMMLRMNEQVFSTLTGLI
ncbi:hypothetical protein [uncultured Kushneria sp.]|uniref:hypothetical protein n=1 Tax=uncultured Kushneria sp. TaxID=905033 RepID=UPI002637FB61|nr:hypothetical protein [uncultured Kushneria sp.]